MTKYIDSRCSGMTMGPNKDACIFTPYRHIIKISTTERQMLCRSCEKYIPKHLPLEQGARYLALLFRKEIANGL